MRDCPSNNVIINESTTSAMFSRFASQQSTPKGAFVPTNMSLIHYPLKPPCGILRASTLTNYSRMILALSAALRSFKGSRIPSIRYPVSFYDDRKTRRKAMGYIISRLREQAKVDTRGSNCLALIVRYSGERAAQPISTPCGNQPF